MTRDAADRSKPSLWAVVGSGITHWIPLVLPLVVTLRAAISGWNPKEVSSLWIAALVVGLPLSWFFGTIHCIVDAWLRDSVDVVWFTGTVLCLVLPIFPVYIMATTTTPFDIRDVHFSTWLFVLPIGYPVVFLPVYWFSNILYPYWRNSYLGEVQPIERS